ncbi:MAG TPA: sulfotransferase [Terriglobales bacterium]|nr:sulfotransferase [Terriglobales bacterium]
MTTIVEHPDSKSSAPAKLEGPLFILSVWRSGSSLLYTLLNQHSQIALLYEGDLPHLHRFLWGRFRNGSWRERWEFWNRGPSRNGIALESMPANVADAWEATRVVYQEVARRKQATIWGEKTPHWYDSPLPMAKRFPDARFIFLWRDMNAVLRSIASAARNDRFFRKAGFTEKVLLGNENLRRACEALKAKNRPVHEVNYEDLTTDPAESMQQICQFLEIPFEENMTSLEGADRSAIASGPHHDIVRSDTIIRERKQTDILTPALRAKIGRYICRWKRLYDGKWPKYPDVLPAGTRPPSFLEIWRDQIFYQAVLCRDRLVAVIYAIVPMKVARGLRFWVWQRSRKNGLFSVS